MTAQFFLVFENCVSYDVFIYFSRKLRYKKINRTSISQPYSGMLPGFIQDLQIWSSTLAAQI